MRSTQERRCRSNRGFTLVEMIVTMMLLSILLTISVMGLLAWQDWSDFNQANEYAETMFLSAQNQLSEYNANGTLEDFAKQTKKYSPAKVKLDSIYYEEGKAYTEDSVWVTKDKGTLVSVCANKGDYSLYAAGKTTTSPTAPIVYQLLESYLYDTSILNDAICVEFSLEDGQVFSVLYCGKANDDDEESFVYSGSDNNLRGQVNIASRYESYRKDRMLGYYGVDTLSKALTTEKAKPKIKVELHNEDTLNLTIRPENMVNAAQKLNYEVTVYDLDPDFCDSENKANGVPVLKFTLRGSDIKNEAAVKNMISSNHYNDVPTYSFTRYIKQDGAWVTQDIGEFPVLSWIESDGTIRVILDAADLQATAKSYALNLHTLKDADKAEQIKNSNFKFKTTYSFHRFGLDATYIKCSVKASGTQYAASVETDSNNSYVYFADENHNTDEGKKVVNYNYSIANARHLYNMRYITDLTANTKGTTDELRLSNAHYGQKETDRDKKIACHFQLTEDIDWAKFVEDGQYFDTKGNGIKVSGDDISDEESKAIASAFVSMRQLRAEDSLDGGQDDVGNPHTIRNLTISQAANVLGWVYAVVTDESTYGEQNTTGSKSDDTKKPVGLVATNYGTIQNLKLEAVQVTSPGDYAGTFAGITVCGTDADGTATGVLKNLEVVCKNPNDENASYVKGSSYVGGIVGKLEGTEADGKATKVEWSKLVNAAKVTGKAYVGGIVGELRTDAARTSSITLSECENYGAVYAVLKQSDAADVAKKAECRFIGGIVGLSANLYGAKNKDAVDAQNCITIKDCVSTPVYGDDDAKQFLRANNGEAFANYGNTIVGNYVGGIAGYSYYSTLEHVRGAKKSQDDVQQTGYVFGDSYVGGITGYYVGTQPLAGQDADRVAGRNENYVIGCSYVGGITGASADIDETETRNASGVADAATMDILTVIEKSQKVQTVSDEKSKTTVENWNNAGVVYATKQYAGGISGYNTGTIRESVNTVGNVTVTGIYPVDYAADYVGGITGYNHGVIIAADQIKNQVQIFGKNYVGGVVGYNEVGAEVTNYAVSSGSIQGDTKNGSYIGGLAGCNASINMLQNTDGSAKKLYVSTQNISGKYFVGGVIGANIINTNGYSGNKTIEAGENGDSSNVADGTSAGNTTDLCRVELTMDSPYQNQPKMFINFKIVNDSQNSMKNWRLVLNVGEGYSLSSYDGPYRFKADSSLSDKIIITPGQWDNEIPAGGSMNDRMAIQFKDFKSLYSFDVSDIELYYDGGDENKGNLKPGNTAISIKNKHVITGMTDNSYPMQFSGNVGYRYIEIKNNGNYDMFDISLEIPMNSENEFDISLREYANVTCEKKHTTVDGKDEYYWEIKQSENAGEYKGRVQKNDTVQFKGLNFQPDNEEIQNRIRTESRLIFYTSDIQPVTENITYFRIYTSADMKDFAGTITGSAFTGGTIGYTLLADSTDQKYAYNKAEELRKAVAGAGSVDAAATAVCAATGNNTSEVQLYVTGTVGNANATCAGKVTGGTYVGGIVGYNDANTFMYIDQAVSYASVTADTGYAGGIISASRKSNNKIQTSNFYGSVTAKEAAGGITGENQGTISKCNVTNVTITGGNGTSVASYGGIAGVNGIASTKTGDVDAAKITECTFSGTVTGASGDSNVRAHIGGIVGANGFNSTVKASTVGAQATLVSVNEQAGTIANVGGIAGTNYGTIESSDNKVKAADAQTIIKNGSGYTGGIVGCSKKDAVVKGSDAERTTTSAKWTIMVNTSDTGVDTAVGGIIGHSESQTALELMENNATVNVTGGNASVGGIVGKLEGGTGDTLTINKCDNYGAVTGTWYTGGLVGYLRNAATFTGCTSKGTVTGGTTGIMVGFVDRGLENQVTFVEPDYPEGMDSYSFRPTETLADTISEDGQAVQDINTASQTENESADSANGATMEESDGNAIADATDTAAKQDTESTEAIAVVEQLPTPDAEQLAEETWVTQYYDGTEWSLQKAANDAEQEKNTTAAKSGDTQEKITGSYKTRAYTFDIQEHVDLYEVQMQDAGGAYGMLYIQPKKAKAYVYYAGSFADVRRESICDANPYSEFAGILTEENPVSASYAVNVALDDKNTVVLPAVVTMKGETISILLPDTTTYVSVQATVDEEHVDKYENSDIAVWRYILEEDATMTDAVAIGEADESGKVVWSGVLKDEARAAEVPDIAGTSVQIGSGTTAQKVVNYTVAVTQPMLVNILAYDADGNLMKSAYYTVSKDAASFMLETKNWFAKSDDIRIRYSAIGDTGLGDWTEPVQLTESGFSN